MIVYALVCSACSSEIKGGISEEEFLSTLVSQANVKCGSCGNSFVPQDSDFQGKES